MNFEKIRKKAEKIFGVKVEVREDDRSVFLRGKADDWQTVVAVGKMFVDKSSGRHVVNDITLSSGGQKPVYLPPVADGKLDKTDWDVVIIGGGISGCSVARELSRYDLKILLIEKHSDVAHGASGANDGMVHAGIDLKGRSLKLHYVTRGNAMYGKVCDELGVTFKREGQYVVFPSRLIKLLARSYLTRAKKHGIPGVEIIGKKEIDFVEPTVSSYSAGALKIPTTGAVSPYKLTIAYAENAVMNGVTVSLDTAALSMNKKDGKICEIVTNRGTVRCAAVVNCAGVFADVIADMADDRYFSIHPRKGTDLLLDKNVAGQPVNAVSLSPTLKTLKENKNTKGGGIIKTVSGNILLGPDAVETPDREDVSTTAESVAKVFDKQKKCCPSLDKSNIIAYFSGVRACTYEEDFIIERSKRVPNLIHVAGIQSPGLTAAPAFSKDVAEITAEYLRSVGKTVTLKSGWQPQRTEPPRPAAMTDEERAKLIAVNPDYGKIVCRCEEVSLGEIKDAVNNPLGVATVDGVKRRARAGMGRCQGGFCMPLVVKAISEEKAIPCSEVKKGDPVSFIAYGEIKDVYR